MSVTAPAPHVDDVSVGLSEVDDCTGEVVVSDGVVAPGPSVDMSLHSAVEVVEDIEVRGGGGIDSHAGLPNSELCPVHYDSVATYQERVAAGPNKSANKSPSSFVFGSTSLPCTAPGHWLPIQHQHHTLAGPVAKF